MKETKDFDKVGYHCENDNESGECEWERECKCDKNKCHSEEWQYLPETTIIMHYPEGCDTNIRCGFKKSKKNLVKNLLKKGMKSRWKSKWLKGVMWGECKPLCRFIIYLTIVIRYSMVKQYKEGISLLTFDLHDFKWRKF